MPNRRHITGALIHREVGRKRTTRTEDFIVGAKRRKMADTNMSKSEADGERNDGDQRQGYMIPGVDGRLQFAFPKKIITILKYVDNQIQTSVSGGLSTIIYRMNGPYDPDVTNAGHQPMYWDTYTGIYQNARVLGSRIRVDFMPAVLSGSYGPYQIGINGSYSSSSLGTSGGTRAEMSDAVSSTISVDEGGKSLSLVYSPEISLGRPAGDDTVGSTISTFPSNQYFAHVWVGDISGQQASSIVYHKVTIEYTIEFFGLNIPSAS